MNWSRQKRLPSLKQEFQAYNKDMPTPFYHLSLADEILGKPGISPQVRDLLAAHRGAFLFGSTAPDVQTMCGQDRRETHFFDLPISSAMSPAWERMLELYPGLAVPGQLEANQAAFVAGYLCHLQADWLWVIQIFAPVFGPFAGWRTFDKRLYLHNVLRSYLDRQILPSLPPGLASELEQVEPQAWLPPVADNCLVDWRDFLTMQLRPGAKIQTVEVFAARQGIQVEEYYRLLESEDLLDQEIFQKLSRQALEIFRRQLIDENLLLLQDYFYAKGRRL